jgi:hypothetical protein
MTAATRQRRRLQFSLRTLLAIVSLSAVLCSWLAVQLQQGRLASEAAKSLEQAGGSLDLASPEDLPWYERLSGPRIYQVMLDEVKVTDAVAIHLAGLWGLEAVHLCHTGLTDANLANLEGASRLRQLSLDGNPISDAGLEHLRGLRQLRWLTLADTNVTDAGLEHLKGLGKLQYLCLRGTKVTDAGIDRLRATLPQCQVYP